MADLLEDAGGFRKIQRITRNFYTRVAADPRVNHHFRGIDMTALQIKLAQTMAKLLSDDGTVYEYKGERLTLPEYLAKIYGPMGITDIEYHIIGNYYMLSVIEADTPLHVTAAIGGALVTAEPFIVSVRKLPEMIGGRKYV